jgi:hypothetical protein
MALNIAPTILSRLDPEMLAQAVGELEHTDVACFGCSSKIVAGTDEPVELLLFEDPDGRRALVNYAHPQCAKSGVRVRRLPSPPDYLGTSFAPMMRDHVLAPALLWELVGAVRAGPDSDSGRLVDPVAEGLRERGFRQATQRLGDLVAPVAPGWVLLQKGEDLLLRSPDGGRPDEFSRAMRALPAGWLRAVRLSKRVLVVYGSGFGLERPSLARIDGVMQAGGAVAGLVKWSGAPPASRRRRR